MIRSRAFGIVAAMYSAWARSIDSSCSPVHDQPRRGDRLQPVVRRVRLARPRPDDCMTSGRIPWTCRVLFVLLPGPLDKSNVGWSQNCAVRPMATICPIRMRCRRDEGFFVRGPERSRVGSFALVQNPANHQIEMIFQVDRVDARGTVIRERISRAYACPLRLIRIPARTR